MTRKLVVLDTGKMARLDTEKDIFLGSVDMRDSRVTYYMHKTKNGKVFYVNEWSAWDIDRDFNGIAVVDESEVKYYLRRNYPDTCDYDMEAILRVWSDFFKEME